MMQRDSAIHAEPRSNVATASVHEGKTASVALWLAVLSVVLAGIAFTLAIVAHNSTAAIVSMAEQTGRAVAKAETATARANTAEIYAYQVYTELNRLGYPVRTPAEDHVPQPPNTPPENEP
jgi:hypothetical protein